MKKKKGTPNDDESAMTNKSSIKSFRSRVQRTRQHFCIGVRRSRKGLLSCFFSCSLQTNIMELMGKTMVSMKIYRGSHRAASQPPSKLPTIDPRLRAPHAT